MVVGDLQVIAPSRLYLHLKAAKGVSSFIGRRANAPLFRTPFPHAPFQTLTHHSARILNLYKLLHCKTSTSQSASGRRISLPFSLTGNLLSYFALWRTEIPKVNEAAI